MMVVCIYDVLILSEDTNDNAELFICSILLSYKYKICLIFDGFHTIFIVIMSMMFMNFLLQAFILELQFDVASSLLKIITSIKACTASFKDIPF